MNIKKILRASAAALICALTMTATSCSPDVVDIRKEVPKKEYPFTVNGITVKEAVDKVAVFDDSLADIVVYLGSSSQVKLAARSEEVVHPKVDVLPTVGTTEAPDVEKMDKMGVDLILTDEEFPKDVQKKLADEGILVLVCPPATNRTELAELYRAVACVMLGGKTGYGTGDKRCASLLMAIDDILRIIPEKDVPVIGGFVLDEAGTFATDLTLAGSLLAYARMVNLAADQSQFTAEELELAAPSMLFCTHGLSKVLKNNPLFNNLPAVRKGNLVQLGQGELVWQGEALVDGLLRIVTTLYPELDVEGMLPGTQNPSDKPADPADPDNPPDAPGVDEPENPVDRDYPRYVDSNSKAADIKILQDRLIELGYLPPPSNGLYSYWTRECVKQFQERVKLPKTGTADEATMDALFASDAPRFR